MYIILEHLVKMEWIKKTHSKQNKSKTSRDIHVKVPFKNTNHM